MKTQVIPLTKEEIDKLIEAAKENDFAYMLFLTAKTTGRQLGEFYEVRVRDIDFKRKSMIIRLLDYEKPIYTDSFLSDDVLKLIKDYIKKNGLKEDDHLFRKYTDRNIRNLVKNYALLAGIKKNVQFHNFRHYFITELLEKGFSTNQVAELLGFKSKATLINYYPDKKDGDIRKAVKSI